jgi:hypothetical protein
VSTTLTPPARLTVGDRFEALLTVTSAESSKVIGPLADSLGVFLVTDQKTRSVARAGRRENAYRLSLAAFRAGKHALPVFTFLVRTGQRIDTLGSAPDSVTIASVLPEKMKDINDLKPAESFPNYWLWIIPGIILLAAALAYAGYRLVQRMRKIRDLAQAPLPPWEQALAALDALPWREWLDAGQVKRYYYALSEVLKRYIERRFEFNAVEQTTTEILTSMRAYKTPMRDDIGKFFTRSDLVKYAKWVPPADEAESAIEQVREFVMRTKPQEPAPGTAAGAPRPASAQGSA